MAISAARKRPDIHLGWLVLLVVVLPVSAFIAWQWWQAQEERANTAYTLLLAANDECREISTGATAALGEASSFSSSYQLGAMMAIHQWEMTGGSVAIARAHATLREVDRLLLARLPLPSGRLLRDARDKVLQHCSQISDGERYRLAGRSLFGIRVDTERTQGAAQAAMDYLKGKRAKVGQEAKEYNRARVVIETAATKAEIPVQALLAKQAAEVESVAFKQRQIERMQLEVAENKRRGWHPEDSDH